MPNEMTTYKNYMEYYENIFCDGQTTTPRNDVKSMHGKLEMKSKMMDRRIEIWWVGRRRRRVGPKIIRQTKVILFNEMNTFAPLLKFHL